MCAVLCPVAGTSFLNYSRSRTVNLTRQLPNPLLPGYQISGSISRQPAGGRGCLHGTTKSIYHHLKSGRFAVLCCWCGLFRVYKGAAGAPGPGAGAGATSCAIKEAGARNIGHCLPHRSTAELGPSHGGPGSPTWSLGHLVWWPVAPTGTRAGSSAPPPYRRWLVGGAEAARVLGL
jgi:hypothetical protein